MIAGAVVLRPEPGAGRTAARLRAAGIDTLVRPLFAVRPVAWTLPDPADYDALLLTSANAVRHGGDGLAALRRLPVIAVGAATAAAARAAGFAVVATGTGDVADALALARPRRALHLTGVDHRAAVADRVVVYDSVAIDPPPALALAGRVALLHSARAAARLASLVAPAARGSAAVAALSPAVLAAAGTGWAWAAAAPAPDDAALVALVARRSSGCD